MAYTPGISKTAVVSKSARLGKNVSVGDYAFIGDNVCIKDNVFVGRGVIIGEPLKEFYTARKYKNPVTVIGGNSIFRSGTIIYSGSVLGKGFQSGHNAVIREYSVFGENCSFGTYGQADGYVKIGNNCRFHNNVFIASYTVIKNNVFFYPYAITLDSIHPPCQKCRKGPVIESGVVVGAGAIIMARVKVGRGAVIGGGAIVNKDVPTGRLVYGSPVNLSREASDVLCRIDRKRKPYPLSI